MAKVTVHGTAALGFEAVAARWARAFGMLGTRGACG